MERLKEEKEVFEQDKKWHRWFQDQEYSQSDRSRIGFQRRIYFIVDNSSEMLQEDYKPTRCGFVQRCLSAQSVHTVVLTVQV